MFARFTGRIPFMQFLGTHIYMFYLDFVKNSPNLKTSNDVEVFRIFKKSNRNFDQLDSTDQ